MCVCVCGERERKRQRVRETLFTRYVSWETGLVAGSHDYVAGNTGLHGTNKYFLYVGFKILCIWFFVRIGMKLPETITAEMLW